MAQFPRRFREIHPGHERRSQATGFIGHVAVDTLCRSLAISVSPALLESRVAMDNLESSPRELDRPRSVMFYLFFVFFWFFFFSPVHWLTVMQTVRQAGARRYWLKHLSFASEMPNLIGQASCGSSSPRFALLDHFQKCHGNSSPHARGMFVHNGPYVQVIPVSRRKVGRMTS